MTAPTVLTSPAANGGLVSEVKTERRVFVVTTFGGDVSSESGKHESVIEERHTKDRHRRVLFAVGGMEKAHAIAVERAKQLLGCDSLYELLAYG